MAITFRNLFWKKGFMFTFVSIFLISIFAFVLYAASSHVMMDKQNAAAERTEAVVVNMFTKSLSDDVLTTIVKVAGANSLRAMVSYVNATETAIDDPEAFYREVMMNGTVSGTYDVTSLSDDFAMTLTAWNDTEFITIAETSSSTSSESFGDTLAVVQRVSLTSSYEELESLHSMTVTLENASSATSNVLYAAAYNATGSLVALDIQYFGSDGSYTFTFGGELPLTQETYYEVVIAAPFTETDSDYSITSGASDFSCASSDFDCSADSWTLSTSGSETGNIPIDFYLDSPIVGEGFFLGLLNSFEALAEEQLAIDADINVTSIVIDEAGPWEIDVNTTFVISTSKTTVSFSGISGEGFATISVEGLYDPQSILLGYGEFQIVPQNVSDEFDSADFYKHLYYHTYVFNEDAPSFLN